MEWKTVLSSNKDRQIVELKRLPVADLEWLHQNKRSRVFQSHRKTNRDNEDAERHSFHLSDSHKSRDSEGSFPKLISKQRVFQLKLKTQPIAPISREDALLKGLNHRRNLLFEICSTERRFSNLRLNDRCRFDSYRDLKKENTSTESSKLLSNLVLQRNLIKDIYSRGCQGFLISKHKRGQSRLEQSSSPRSPRSSFRMKSRGVSPPLSLFRSSAVLQNPVPKEETYGKQGKFLLSKESTFSRLKSRLIKKSIVGENIVDNRVSRSRENTDGLPQLKSTLVDSKSLDSATSSLTGLVGIKTELITHLKDLFSLRMENSRLNSLKYRQELKILELKMAILEDQDDLITSIQVLERVNRKQTRQIEEKIEEDARLKAAIALEEVKIKAQIDSIILLEQEKSTRRFDLDFNRLPASVSLSDKEFGLKLKKRNIGSRFAEVITLGNRHKVDQNMKTTRSAFERSIPVRAAVKPKYYVPQYSEHRMNQQKKIDSASSFEKDSVFGNNIEDKRLSIAQKGTLRVNKRRSTVFTQEPIKSDISFPHATIEKVGAVQLIEKKEQSDKDIEGSSQQKPTENNGFVSQCFDTYAQKVLKGMKRFDRGESTEENTGRNHLKPQGGSIFTPLSPISEKNMDTPYCNPHERKPAQGGTSKNSMLKLPFGIFVIPPDQDKTNELPSVPQTNLAIDPSRSPLAKEKDDCIKSGSKEFQFSMNTLNDLKLLCSGISPKNAMVRKGSIDDDLKFPNSKSMGFDASFLQPKTQEEVKIPENPAPSENRAVQESRMTVIGSRSSLDKAELEESKNMDAEMHWLKLETPSRTKKKKTKKKEEQIERKLNYSMNQLSPTENLEDLARNLAQGILKSIQRVTMRPKSMKPLLGKYDKRYLKPIDSNFNESSSSDDIDEGYLSQAASAMCSNLSTGGNRRSKTRHTLADQAPSPIKALKVEESQVHSPIRAPTLNQLGGISDRSSVFKTNNLRRSSEELSRNSNNQWLPSSPQSIAAGPKNVQDTRPLNVDMSHSRHTSPSFSSRVKTTEYEFISYSSN